MASTRRVSWWWGPAVLLLLGAALAIDAQTTTTTVAPVVNGTTVNPTTTTTTRAPNATTAAPAAKIITMSWQAWLAVATCVVLLISLTLGLVDCCPGIVMASTFLHLCGIIGVPELLAGLSSPSVLTIALLFIVVDPIAELPLVKKGVGLCLSGTGGTRFSLFKIIVMCLLTSSFLNNAPQVAMLTTMIKNYCRDNGLFPSQFLMPMNFATLCGNYAIIGTSTNLIVDGLMRKLNMGPMPFFELVKINGPFTIVMLTYLVFMPAFLLPLAGTGLVRVVRDSTKFLVQAVVGENSELIGRRVNDIGASISQIHPDVAIIQITRDKAVIFPLSGDEVIEHGDALSIRGDGTDLSSLGPRWGLTWQTVSTSDADLTKSMCAPPSEAEMREPVSNGSMPRTPGYPGTPGRTTRDAMLTSSFSAATFRHHQRSVTVHHEHTAFFEVVVSHRAPHVSTAVGAGTFQSRYNASILTCRPINGDDALSGAELAHHIITPGDTLLLLARGDFVEEWQESKEFLVINTCTAEEGETEQQITLRCPSCWPLGDEQVDDKGKPVKLWKLPIWYPYLLIPAFLAMISSAIAGFEIAVCALVACIGIISIGLLTTSQALQLVELEVIVMVAFSFGIGAAMENSGFAAFLGQTVRDANVSGIALLYVIAAITTLMTNVITNKACVQVLVPLIAAIYRAQKVNPLPPVMMCCSLASMALSTPHGFATNLMVMGPGGYTPFDFIKFGVPLNILGTAIVPLITAGVYQLSW